MLPCCQAIKMSSCAPGSWSRYTAALQTAGQGIRQRSIVNSFFPCSCAPGSWSKYKAALRPADHDTQLRSSVHNCSPVYTTTLQCTQLLSSVHNYAPVYTTTALYAAGQLHSCALGSWSKHKAAIQAAVKDEQPSSRQLDKTHSYASGRRRYTDALCSWSRHTDALGSLS
jgi:hypothetical protein